MVIRAFNGVYFGVMILTVLLIVAITKIFSKKYKRNIQLSVGRLLHIIKTYRQKFIRAQIFS